MYRIEIDRSLCSGIASCVKIAPSSFDLGADGVAIAVGVADDLALEAAECCPLGALSVFDAADGRRLV